MTDTAPAVGPALRVAHLDTGREWRGGQAQVMALLEGLAPRGVTGLLLAPRGPLLARARERGFEAAVWEPRGDWDLGALARAVRLLAGFRPDVVHAHSARAHALGVPAARIAGVPAVLVSRRVAVPVARNPASALKYRMPVQRYLCVSRSVRDTMRAAGIPESRLAIVPSGVTFDVAPPDVPLRTLLGAPPGAPVVGTVAALTAEKRHEDLLEAAVEVRRAVPAVHFAWFGEGPRRPWLERRRAQLGLEGRIHLLGFRPDARALAGQCTVIALASELEGIATSLMEAQALGVPVVATAVGGIPEVVEDGVGGRLVRPRDPPALAAAIVEALTQPQVTREWVANARASVQRFHIDRTLELTLAEYRAALAGRSSPA